MEIVRGYQTLTTSLKHPVVTIGNFDGIHLGHRKIISLALEKAKARNGQCVVYTFRPHPQLVLRPGGETRLLSTYEEKLDLLEKLGVDLVIEEPFQAGFFMLSPADFFEKALVQAIGAESIVVGHDFTFGREREGHLELLQKFCTQRQIEIEVVPAQKIEGLIVSSSRIRKTLSSSKVEEAKELLGRFFSYQGTVIEGDKRGRTLGFPTANLKIADKIVLPYGVYATRVIVEGQAYPSVTNIGVRPTFRTIPDEAVEPLIESYLFDVDKDLYGKKIQVEFIAYLRPEIRFQSLEALKDQMLADVQQAKSILHKSN